MLNSNRKSVFLLVALSIQFGLMSSAFFVMSEARGSEKTAAISQNSPAGNSFLPKEGKEYVLVQPQQPSSVPNKQEVIEFFWFGCPHCFMLEPSLAKWKESLPATVSFRKVHVPFGNRHHHKLAVTLAVMGKDTPEIHKKIFEAIHVKNLPVTTSEEMLKILTPAGIDSKKFLEAYNSFSVEAKINQEVNLAKSYSIDSVPVFSVCGAYLTAPHTAGGVDKAFLTIDFLLSQGKCKATEK